ncbi:MAG: phosphatase PAP2 family protein [Bacilli bacterium]|nr:phosphatase PAP2 family protein [Bacilli bacterium]
MTNFEIEILNKIRENISSFFDSLFKFITNFGGQEILILTILVVYFVFSKKQGQRIAFSIFTSLLVNNSLKVVVDRIRPFNHPNATYPVEEAVREHASGMSFPSGHAQNAAVTYSSIAFSYKKNYLWIISSILILLVGLSRVILGVHYPTDVIIGIILGVVLAYFGLKLHEKYENDFKNQIRLYLIVAIIFLPFLFIYLNKLKTNYFEYKDLFTIYSFYIGYILAVLLEKKYLDFDESVHLKFRIIRAIIAIIIVLGLLIGLKAVFPKDNIIFDMIRYFMLSFVAIGVYPIILKNSLFKKN